jgi:hypothetical protein
MPNFGELRYGEVRRIYLPFLAVCWVSLMALSSRNPSLQARAWRVLLWVLTISSYPCFLGLVYSSSPKREWTMKQACGSSVTRRLPPGKSQ